MLNVSILSTGKKFCDWYQNLAFERQTCSVPEGHCVIAKANMLR